MAIATKDLYTWCAVYTDDTFIGEYHGRPDGRGFAEVDKTRVKQFKLESSLAHLRSHYVDVPHGAEPIFFRRRIVGVNSMTGKSDVATIHSIGWKQDENACYLFIFEDGSSLLSTDLQAV